MILSMTGYGAARGTEDGVSYAVEIRSLNNRYYKASIKLPDGMQWLEARVDGWLRESLGRGSISYTLRMRDNSPQSVGTINATAVSAYVDQLRQMTGSRPGTTIDLAALLTLPGMCDEPELDEESRARRVGAVERLTREAVRGLMAMRRAEGSALRTHLLEQLDQIRSRLETVQRRSPVVVEEYQEKLKARINRLLQQAQLELDRDSLTREVAIFADHCDIGEEIARLGSHLEQFRTMCDSKDESGRRLDFLAQEMLREANTIGSKSNDAEITQNVVDIKAAIERLKEQVQNVE